MEETVDRKAAWASAAGLPLRFQRLRLTILIRRVVPLALLGGGAGGMFLSNILAKRMLTPGEFVDWAYLMSLTTFFFSFSLLGSEQLIVRSARNTENGLAIPRDAAAWIAGSFVGFLGVYWLVLDGRLFEYHLGILSVPVLASVGLIQVVYQAERARGQLATSQFAYNLWKVALVALLPLGVWLMRGSRAEFAFVAALALGILSAGWVLFRARRAIRLSNERSDARRVFVPFMISLGIMAVLGIADRIVLSKVHASEAFAGYVYLTTILATPFTILSSYFGFKEAVRYRAAYSPRMVRDDTIRTMGITAALVVAWMLVCYLTRGLSGVSTDPGLWVLLGVVSVLRCGYGVLSAAMGVRGSARAIYCANALTALALVAYLASAVALRVSVIAIVGGYVAVWGWRLLSYYWLIDHARSAPAIS